MLIPPDWIDLESWEAFHEMRRKIKAPLTTYAERLIIGELVKLKGGGEDPQLCLDQSIMNGWRDVFRLRDKGIVQTGPKEYYKAPAPMTAEEKAASDRARKMAMESLGRRAK